MSGGIFLECDWCGEQQTSRTAKNIRSLRKSMQTIDIEIYDDIKLDKWVSLIVAGRGTYDFCSRQCYQKWKDDLSR